MKGSWLLFPVLVICVACVTAGGYFAIGNLLFISAAATAEGEIAANRMQWRQGRFDWWQSYYALVDFSDHRGVRHSVESEEYYYDPMPVGNSVPVYCLPVDPTTARLGDQYLWTRAYRWAAPGAVGLLFFGAMLLIVRRRERHDP